MEFNSIDILTSVRPASELVWGQVHVKMDRYILITDCQLALCIHTLPFLWFYYADI